jgi:hypothetical protein
MRPGLPDALAFAVLWIYLSPMTKKTPPKAAKPATPAKAAAKPDAIAKSAAPEAADKPAAAKRPVFVAPPKPGGNYPGAPSGGKGGGAKPHGANTPKGRIFRHQGR